MVDQILYSLNYVRFREEGWMSHPTLALAEPLHSAKSSIDFNDIGPSLND